MLTIVDIYTRECLQIAVTPSINGSAVATVLEERIEERGSSDCIISDNGTEFTSRCVNKWI